MTKGSVRVSVFGKTDLGRTRDHNEDTYLVADLSTGVVVSSASPAEHVVGSRGSLFMVADGMGGAAAGELASSMAAQAIFEYLNSTWRTDVDSSGDRFAFRLREAVEKANAEIHAYAQEHSDVRGMGTTLTAAAAFGSTLYLAQIGDSRAYLIRDGRAFQLTKDQSLTQRLVDAGELTEEEAETNVRRNIILQALGPDPRVRVVLSTEELRREDVLVVCSDGLSGPVRKDEIADLVAREPDLARVGSALIDLANERGGPDNITVVAVRFSGNGLRSAGDESEPGYNVLRLPGGASVSDESNPAVPAAGHGSPVRAPDTSAAAGKAGGGEPLAARADRSAARAALVGIGLALLAAGLWFLLL
jgi:protein phosphatase